MKHTTERIVNAMSNYLIIVLIIFLTACAPRQHIIGATFDESQFAPYLHRGTSTITGQAFVKTRGGEVRFGAGNEVKLVPYNAYTHEIWQANLGNMSIANKDPRLERYIRITTADGFGNFTFENVPPGHYILQCMIYWEVPSGYISRTTGSTVFAHANVNDGETAKVILTSQ
jgi:hypothetical protein